VCVNTMLRRTNISKDLREANVAAHQSGEGLRPFPNDLESIIYIVRDYLQVESI